MRGIVLFCVLYVVRITEWSLRICETTQISPAAVYGTAVGFFGAELVMMIVKKIMQNKDAPTETPTAEGTKVEGGKPLPLP